MNTIKTTALLTVLTLILVWAGGALGGQGGAIFAFVLAVVMNFGSYWFSDRIVLSMYKAREVNELEEPEFYGMVKALATSAGLPMPKVYIIPQDAPNAFATGMNRNSALVAVSTGLLERMSRVEVEAVLAHEVSHVANGDMITLTLIQGVVNTFVFFLSRVIGHLVDRLVFKVERGHGPAYWITAIVAQLVLGILASAIVMWFSRWREYRADQGGATLAGRRNMIAALQRLQSSVNQAHLPEQMAAFGISGGFRKGLAAAFMSHPPLEDRIRALQELPGD